MASYSVYYKPNRCVEVTRKGLSIKCYRIPFHLLESKKHGITVESNFVVYLLSGKDPEGNDCLYVGTSTSGIDNRPTSHEDKNVTWSECIVFTLTDSTLNNSCILYLENSIRHMIDETKRYVNKTQSTTGKAANEEERELCEELLPKIREVYDILGIDLTPKYKSGGLDGYSPSAPETENIVTADYSPLKLPAEMKEWLECTEKIVRALDPEIIGNVTSTYANFKYKGVSKTIAYCYPVKSKKQIRVLLQGTPDWYSDPKVVDRPENMHNGDCKAMFFINSADDLRYLRLFAETALKRMNRI